MPRILFIVNEHPNEAFGISSARETAKLLKEQGFRLLVEGKDRIPKKAQGNEVVLVKVKPAETLLGRTLKGLPLKTERQQKSKVSVEWYWTAVRGIEIAITKAKKYGPAIIYGFHCAPQGDKAYFSKGAADYDIRNYKIQGAEKQVLTRIIEIKTHQKEIPPKAMERIRESGKQTLRKPFTRYLTHTTSQELNRKAGLTPEEFGKVLAKIISKEVVEKKQKLEHLRGGVKRIYPKTRVQKRKRRA